MVDVPPRISSGSPASAAFTLSEVRGQCSPTSGSAWIARRNSIAASRLSSPIAAQSVVDSKSSDMIGYLCKTWCTGPANARPVPMPLYTTAPHPLHHLGERSG
ncbi:hypothetical protein [Sphingomonas sp. 22R3R2A-7]|uniref:hypothetical protein n=1 Tax=Sphingomonas sp. 22R3R2A-7 TaxID=3050230 RepID=UPI002FE0E0EE